MEITKRKEMPICKIVINGAEIKQVKQFEYLGRIIRSNDRSDPDIKTRIGNIGINENE